LPGADEPQQADGSEHFAEEADGGEQPAALGDTGHLPVEDAVDADDHTQAGEDSRVILRRHAGEAE
jgi:hypothetical protein